MQDVTSGGFLFYMSECDIANERGKAPGLLLALKLNKLAGVNNSHPPIPQEWNPWRFAIKYLLAESSGLKRLLPDKLVK